jgi:hypothetical protein
METALLAFMNAALAGVLLIGPLREFLGLEEPSLREWLVIVPVSGAAGLLFRFFLPRSGHTGKDTGSAGPEKT